MENGNDDLLVDETDGFTTPTNNTDRKITDLRHKPGFKRSEIVSRRLLESSPLSRGMITLRKIDLVKVFCDEFLMGEILESFSAFKSRMCETVKMSDIAEVDSVSAICLTSENKVMDLQEHQAPKAHLQNENNDYEVVADMASQSVSKHASAVEMVDKPDTRTGDFGRGKSGSFIHIPTVRRESAVCALPGKQNDSVVSSRGGKSKKDRKLKGHKRTEKTVSAKTHSNLTLQSSGRPHIIGARTDCVSSTEASDKINKSLNNRSDEHTDSPEQLPDNISVFKVPALHKQSKRIVRQKPQGQDLKVSTKGRYSCGNVSVSSFDDSSFSPVQFNLPHESPQESSSRPNKREQCVSSEISGQSELIPIKNHHKVQNSKRKIKNDKASVAEERSNRKSSKEDSVVEVKGRHNTRSAVKHSVQECHVEELRNECAYNAPQINVLELGKSHKLSSRIKVTSKSGQSGNKNVTENTHEQVLEASLVMHMDKSKHVLTENTAILNMSNEKIQSLETNKCGTSLEGTHGKVSTRKRRGVVKALSDVVKEPNLASRRSLIAKKINPHLAAEQSLILKASSSQMSLANGTSSFNNKHRDVILDSSALLESKKASVDVGVSCLRNRNSLTKPASSKPPQSKRSSLPVFTAGDKRPNSITSNRRSGLGEQCSENKNQTEKRLHVNPKSSFSGSSSRNKPSKAVSAGIHNQTGAVLNVAENLKVNKLQGLCDISVHGGLRGSHQVVEDSSNVTMPPRQLRKRKVNINLAENADDKATEISVPTHVKAVKPAKRNTKVKTGSLQEKRVQTRQTAKKQTAKKDSYLEVAADNEQASKVKKSLTRRKPNEATANVLAVEGSSKKDKMLAHKKPTKVKNGIQSKQNEVASSDSRKASQKFVGAHCSAAGGVSNAVVEAVAIGARAFALFVRNGRTWKLNPLDVAEAEKFKEACKVHGFLPRHILPHGSYLLNCGSSNVDTLQKSRDTLVHELQICEMLGLEMYNFHPGSACGKGTIDECLLTVAESINLAHEKTHYVKTVIENMSGQGRTVGGKFEELKTIIEHVKDKSRIGVCLDTCHAFAAGFDLSSEEGFNKCIESFDKIVGLHYLCALHLNDSKGELGCRLDRHENIGKGHIGLEGFRYVMNDPRLNNIPMILETPVNDCAKEIKILCDLEDI